MSKFLTINTVFRDLDTILETLKEMGYDDIQTGHNITLKGYLNDDRAERANIRIDKKYLGSVSNDIGFIKTAEGYKMVIGDYDKAHLREGRFVQDFTQLYAKNMTLKTLKKKGYTVTQKTEGKSIKLVCRRW